ncbi:amino acid ABC transporter permease [Stutzerimonas kunmingensis]|uniref:amino acid ABC transporter permease n=1 Tax=Stutzerimonas kunmingensis TaxID=1211807 RepID=UPI00241FF94F|nr:amino acid ABC transporter permease [Stutzerimonas kunmingensis]
MEYSFDFGAMWEYRWVFAKSIWLTVELSVLAIILGTVLGVIMGAGRAIEPRSWLMRSVWGASTVYVYLQLAIPALVLLVWMYYCLPLMGIHISGFWTAVIALGTNLSPFAAEIFRSSLRNMPRGEMQAASAMGYTPVQIFLYFSVPHFVRNSIPPLMGQYYTTLKMSSLASVIGVFEIINTAQEVINQTYKTIEVYTMVALCYAIVVIPFAILAKRYEDRVFVVRN